MTKIHFGDIENPRPLIDLSDVRENPGFTLNDVVQHLLDYINDHQGEENIGERSVVAYDDDINAFRPLIDYDWAEGGFIFELGEPTVNIHNDEPPSRYSLLQQANLIMSKIRRRIDEDETLVIHPSGKLGVIKKRFEPDNQNQPAPKPSLKDLARAEMLRRDKAVIAQGSIQAGDLVKFSEGTVKIVEDYPDFLNVQLTSTPTRKDYTIMPPEKKKTKND